MGKHKIWIIIILMTTALLGSIFIQSYWIKLAVDENETKFDNNVFEGLNKVSELLQREKEYHAQKYIFQLKDNSLNLNESNRLEINLARLKEMDTLLMDVNRHFANQASRKLQQVREKAYLENQFDEYSLAERIDLKTLSFYIKTSMQDAGIKIPFRYGVFSNKKNAFVIINDRYSFEETDDAGMSKASGNESLYNSQYEVTLFPSDFRSSLGKLKVYFPNRTKFVWSDILPFLVASIIFTSIILLSFYYTITVIFRQKKLSEIKTDFINNMTHEFKTPIATISLASDSILNPTVIDNHSKITKFANLIKVENKRMLNQVEKVLQIAQIDKKDLQLKWTNVNLHDVIKEATEHINLQLSSKQGFAEAKLLAKTPTVPGDLIHISNIIHNLLDNANKYTPDKPYIEITTKDHKGGVQIVVSDNGIGMSNESRKHIFEKFYRVPTGNLHDVKGFGLGLSYVMTMMNAHQGTVEVKSELGKGSKFILFFPGSKAA